MAFILLSARRRFAAALLPRLFENNVPGHTTRAPPVGFELATNGIQFYAIVTSIANLDKTSLHNIRKYQKYDCQQFSVCKAQYHGNSRTDANIFLLSVSPSWHWSMIGSLLAAVQSHTSDLNWKSLLICKWTRIRDSIGSLIKETINAQRYSA